MPLILKVPKQAAKLLAYLDSNGGIETSTFNNSDEANIYANTLRDTHKKYLNELISIEANYNKVIIKNILTNPKYS